MGQHRTAPFHAVATVRACGPQRRPSVWPTRGVPRNRRRRGTPVIALRAGALAGNALRAALFVQDCASCGGFGCYLLSCGLSEFTKRKSDRNPSHETQKQPRGLHQTQFRPRGHARNANPTSRTGVAASRRSWLHATSLMHRVRSTSCSATASRWSSMRSSWPSLGTIKGPGSASDESVTDGTGSEEFRSWFRRRLLTLQNPKRVYMRLVAWGHPVCACGVAGGVVSGP